MRRHEHVSTNLRQCANVASLGAEGKTVADQFHGSIELAKVGLTSIIASSSGLLIGLFAFAGQRGVSDTIRPFLIAAVSLTGLALLLAITSSIVGYLSQLSFDNGGENKPLWLPAFVLCCLSVLCLAAAMVSGGLMLLA